jgi:hypothetical protein
MLQSIKQQLSKPVDIAPLITFRILFGFLGVGGLLWSILKGDIQKRYWEPDFFFDYYGFEWLPYLGDAGIVVVYVLGIIGALGISLGFFFRISTAIFALTFSYLHTIDATNFINHYYLIWIFALYLFFSPANRAVSLDVAFRRTYELGRIPRYYLVIFQLQLAIVYFFAGLAKLNPDWIFRAMPMKIWLLQHSDFPLLGNIFKENWAHFAASWFAAFYDLTITFWLFWKRSRPFAYLAVVVFHLFTWALFNIGLFPPLMIAATLIFFSPFWHRKLHNFLQLPQATVPDYGTNRLEFWKVRFLLIFLFFQMLIPLRHLAFGVYNPAWRQEFMRYAWRVMLVEHEGLANFKVCSNEDDRIWEVDSNDFLTEYQIKRMGVQPEHMRQFAHYLAEHYQTKYQLSIRPAVRVDAVVVYNGRLSKTLVNPKVDLASETACWCKQTWVLD